MSFAPWIKMETTTPDKPEVVAMAERLRLKDHDLIVGKLVRLWAWADANSVDGCGVKVSRAFIDRLVNLKGFAAALEKEKWLAGPDGAIDFPGFERHNGESAKSRSTEARRKADQRAREREERLRGGTNVPDNSGQKAGPEEEIDIKKEKGGADGGPADGGQVKPVPHDPLLVAVCDLRTDYGKPILDQRERGPFHDARPVLESWTAEDWQKVHRYLNAKLPPGIEVYQPDRRILFLQAAAEIHGKALAWDEKQQGKQPTHAAKPWPEEFEAWRAVNYSSLSTSSAWAMAAVREEFRAWRESGREDAA